MAQFLQNIREARISAGLTQKDLADYLGVQRSTLSKYETGHLPISYTQLKLIAQATGTTLSELFKEEGEQIMQNTKDTCIITKDLPEKTCSFRHIGISDAIYAEMLEIANQTGRSIRYLANTMLRFAIDRLEIQD